ncbi:MAG TPA: urease accessory protein UreD [Methylomirabilota bacterium]
MLRERCFTLPLQALEPLDLEADVATLLLLNPTGGLLAGDRLETQITLGARAAVCLSTPSATRVYRSPGPPAVQHVAIALGAGATLEWMPDHLIPSPGARLRQSTVITLAPGATLLYLDAWAVGRAARGERWGFDLLDSRLEVSDESGMLLRERSILAGGLARDDLGGTEGFGYVASFVALRSGREDWDDLTRALHEILGTPASGVRAGVSALARGGVLARLLCASAPALRTGVDALWACCRRHLLGKGPLDLRKQ